MAAMCKMRLRDGGGVWQLRTEAVRGGSKKVADGSRRSVWVAAGALSGARGVVVGRRDGPLECGTCTWAAAGARFSTARQMLVRVHRRH